MSINKKNELRECFEMLDTNNNGKLEFHELSNALAALSVKHFPDQLSRMMGREVRSKKSALRDRHHQGSVTASSHSRISTHTAPTVSYGDFVDIMTDILPSESDSTQIGSSSDRGQHVGLPLRLMLSAFRRKRILEEFMNNSSARARLAARGQEQASRGLHGDGASSTEKMQRSSSSEGLNAMSRSHPSGNQHKRNHTSYSQNRRKQHHKVTSLKTDTFCSQEKFDESRSSLTPISSRLSVMGGRQTAMSPRQKDKLIVKRPGKFPFATSIASLDDSQHSGRATTESQSVSLLGLSTTSLPTVRAQTSCSFQNLKEVSETEFIRAPKTASRANRHKLKQHEQVSHLAWQQQQLLLRQFANYSPSNTGDNSLPAPPDNLKELQHQNQRPSTSMIMQKASQSLESQSLSYYIRTQNKSTYHENAAEKKESPPFAGETKLHSSVASDAARNSTKGTSSKQRPWSRYKTWKSDQVASKYPWITEGADVQWNSMRTLGRIKLMRDENTTTNNEMAIKLHAMRLVRD